MTVGELRKILEAVSDDAPVVFAECEHHHVDIDDYELTGAGLALKSVGWTDDCDCQ